MVEVVAISVFLACILFYYIFYFYECEIDKTMTARKLLNVYREAWIKKQVNENNQMVIVQTVRNIIMVSSFIASSLVIFVSLVLNKIVIFHEGQDIFSLQNQPWIMWKLYLLISLLCLCVLKLLNSIRHLLRFNIVAGSDFSLMEKYEGVDGIKHCAESMKKSADGFAFAIRGLYYSLAMVLWFFDSYLFITATVTLTIVLCFFKDFRRV